MNPSTSIITSDLRLPTVMLLVPVNVAALEDLQAIVAYGITLASMPTGGR